MQVYKSHYGWCAESTVECGSYFVRITTMKRSNGSLVTSAVAGKEENGCFSFMMYSDFSKILISTKCRVTEQAVRNQHSQVDIESLVKEVKEYYLEEVC